MQDKIKWIFLVITLVFLAVVIYMGYLYFTIQDNKTAGMDVSRERVINETSITTINQVKRFHGEEAYHIVNGKTNKGAEKIAMVPLKGKNSDIIVIDKKKIVDGESIKQDWNNQCSKCKLISLTPGMLKDNPIWELTYKNNKNRYIIDYLSIYDGSRYEQFRFKRTFN